MNTGPTKHKKRIHSLCNRHIILGMSSSNFVYLIKYIPQWISNTNNDFSRLQQKHTITHTLIYSSLYVQHTAITHPKWLLREYGLRLLNDIQRWQIPTKQQNKTEIIETCFTTKIVSFSLYNQITTIKPVSSMAQTPPRHAGNIWYKMKPLFSLSKAKDASDPI